MEVLNEIKLCYEYITNAWKFKWTTLFLWYSLEDISVGTGALLLDTGNEAADRRARFAVVSRDAPSADTVLDTDNAESSTAVAMHDSATTNDASAADHGKSVSGGHLSGVRWSSCESSNGGVSEPRPRTTSGLSSVITSTTRRGRYLAVHRYAPQNTSTGSSTSGIDVSMSSSRSELMWAGGSKRSAAAVAASCVGAAVVSSVDADCEDNCDDLVDDSLSLYRSSSFRRAIERGGNASPPTPTTADDVADRPSDHYCLSAPRYTPSLTSSARLPFATSHHQPSELTFHRCTADYSRTDTHELANPCVSPDDVSAAKRPVWDVSGETDSQHVEDIDPFHSFGLSAELGYDFSTMLSLLLFTTDVVCYHYWCGVVEKRTGIVIESRWFHSLLPSNFVHVVDIRVSQLPSNCGTTCCTSSSAVAERPHELGDFKGGGSLLR